VTFGATWNALKERWEWDDSPSEKKRVDIDGDQWADAILYATGVKNVMWWTAEEDLKQIIERHGGRIWVQSEGRYKGSKFSFVLPLSQPGKKI
jgi:hypothetical protein